MTSLLNYGLVAVLFVAWIGLFTVKDMARDTAAEAEELERRIALEDARLGELMTDWAIRNEPAYLQRLAQLHLGLQATHPSQIVTMSALPPVPLDEREDPSPGTFFAAARNYRPLPQARRTDPYTNPFANMPRPVPRPSPHPMPRPDEGR